MFFHVFVSGRDFERGLRLYGVLMNSLGVELRFLRAQEAMGWLVQRSPMTEAVPPGNWQMATFAAASRKTFRASYQTALDHGETCEGPPGLRPPYHENYDGAYFHGPGGNKLCVACHVPTADAV